MELYDYQREAAAQISRNGHPIYLADEMGVGKSATAIAVAKRRGVKRLLIVCPAVARLSWVKEFKRWWPELPVTVVKRPSDVDTMRNEGAYLLSYSLLSQSKSGFDYTAAVRDIPTFDMSVLDEAHALKNPKSIRTRAVLITLKPVLGFVLPMSGTPMPNHQGELYPILHALFPRVIRKLDGTLMRQSEFEETYCHVETRFFTPNRGTRVITGSKNIETLRALFRPYVIRRRKRDVLADLPAMSFDTYPVEVEASLIDPEWLDEDSWRELSDDGLIDRLRQADEHLMRKRHMLGIAKLPGAVEAIAGALEGSTRKVLVFALHHDVIDGLTRGLGDYSPVRIDGRDSPMVRARSIEIFLTEPRCRVFIGQILAAGTAITLVGPGMECSDVFFAEADWSPGNNVQAASRVHRIGQKDAVQVWFLCAHGTLDDRIQDILRRKASDFYELFG